MTPYSFQFQCFTAEILMMKPVIELDIKGRSFYTPFSNTHYLCLVGDPTYKAGKIITV
jgi:hypothetical protein